jgi:hypothetical protein
MTKSRDIADLGAVTTRLDTVGASSGALSNRNLVINGAMQVAQRGTSAATANSSNEGYNTLDRWYILYSSSAGGAATMSQDTTVPNKSFTNSLKLDVTTADTSVDVNHAITLQCRIEAQDIANSGWDYTNSDSNMSVSFWARSVKAGTYCVFFLTDDGTQKSLVQEYTLEANTWKYVTLTFKGDSGISFNNDNGLGLYVGWALVAGSNRYQSATAGTWIERSSGNGQARYATSNQVNFFDSTSNDFYLTGVQLEVGDTATDFEHRTFADELARAKRYYNSSYAYGVPAGTADTTSPIGHMSRGGAYNILGQFFHTTPMRVAPSVSMYNPLNGTAGQFRGDGASFANAALLFNGYQGAVFYVNGTTVTATVFLQVHAIFDAEL